MKKSLLLIIAVLLAGFAAMAQDPAVVEKLKNEKPDIVPYKPAKQNRAQQVQSIKDGTHGEEGHVHTGGCCNSGLGMCGSAEYNEALRAKFRTIPSREELDRFVAEKAKSGVHLRSSSLKTSTTTGEKVYQIPVIVHVVYYDGQAVGTDHNLSAETIYSQIEVMNEDFRRKSNTRGYNNEPAGADARIEFVLAQYDPKGNRLTEPGIDRIKAEEITDGKDYLNTTSRFMSTSTASWVKMQTIWEPNCYMNMWCVGLIAPTLGFALFPETDYYDNIPAASISTAQTDGVVVDYRRFGSYEKGPFAGLNQGALGRTATHEAGHFFGLQHIYGDGATDNFGQRPMGCLVDDGVADTPNQKETGEGMRVPTYACGEREMLENYMGYAPEDLMNIFTKGQVERMHILLESSPRRKELLTSTVADPDGEKMPQLTLKVAATTMNVYDMFSFEAAIERFPGECTWEFEGGSPATATGHIVGTFFTTPGKKRIKVTVRNNHAEISRIMEVTVVENVPCDAFYGSTRESLPEIQSNTAYNGNYALGHSDLTGRKQLANRFSLTNNSELQAITQIEIDINRVYFRPNRTFNPDTLAAFYIMSEGYDSVSVVKTMNADDSYTISAYQIFSRKPGTTEWVARNPVITAVDGDLTAKINGHPEMYYNIHTATSGSASTVTARARVPYDTLAVKKVKAGDLLKAYQNNRSYRILLDDPVRPATDAYFVVWNLDYDYYLPRRAYAFELKAGEPSVNFAWENSIATVSSAQNTPEYYSICEWRPFTIETVYNGVGNNALLHLLPVFVNDTTLFPRPGFTMPANQAAIGETVTFTAAAKPSGVDAYHWTIEREDGSLYTIEGADAATYSFTKSGRYKVTLTSVGATCLQRSTSKYITVKGIEFSLTSSAGDHPEVYCSTKPIILKVRELFKSGTNVTYTWHGLGVEGQTGLQKSVTPGSTQTYRVDAVDTGDPGITASASITVTAKLAEPVADFTVKNAHYQHNDTLDIYVSSNDDFTLSATNISESASYFSFPASTTTDGLTIKEVAQEMDARWEIAGTGDKAYFTSSSSRKKDYSAGVASFSDGPGVYKFTLTVANRGCTPDTTRVGTTVSANIDIMDPSGVGYTRARPYAKYASKTVYLNLLSKDHFGEITFTGNGQKLSIAPPAKYPSARDGYYSAYADKDGNLTLEAVSDEITSIAWVNAFSNKNERYTDTKTVALTNIQDITDFRVTTKRVRVKNGQSIEFEEENVIRVFRHYEAPTALAVAAFSSTSDSICTGGSVKLLNSTRNAIDFKWEFPAGAVLEPDLKYFDLFSNAWQPTLRFHDPGEYKIRLTATSIDGSTTTAEKSIMVGAAIATPKFQFLTSTRQGAARISNDTIYCTPGGGFTLSVGGNGIREIVSYEEYIYRQDRGYSEWMVKKIGTGTNTLFRPNLVYHEQGNEPGQVASQRLRITALDCNRRTLTHTFVIRVLPILITENYAIEINGQDQSLILKTLPTQTLCPGQPLTGKVTCFDPSVEDAIQYSWYRVDDNQNRIQTIGTRSSITFTPTENAMYEVEFKDKASYYYSFFIPVKVGVDTTQLEVRNTDLTRRNDTILLPRNYKSDVILVINGLMHPTWNERGSSTILSESNAVVLPPADGTYEVQANSSAECTYKLEFTIKTTPVEDEDEQKPTNDEGKAIEMYPIPARDILNIDSSYDGDAYIVNGSGQLIRRFRLTAGKSTLDLYGLSAGIYRLVVQQAKGGKIISREFIVVR